jgi:rod shape-determining protein MreD
MPNDTLLRRQSAYPHQINRSHSPVLASALPWVSVILASIVPSWLMIASAPMMPPFAFLCLLAWRQLRPGLLPVWAGLPLGMVDDLFSGQPFGSAVVLWSVMLIGMEVLEARFPWRNFLVDWLVGAAIIVLYLLGALAIANHGGNGMNALLLLPQLIISILVFPLVGRAVAMLDRLRLARFRTLL